MSRKRLAAMAAAVVALGSSAANAEPSEFAGFYAGAHAGYIDLNADFNGGDLDAGGTIGGLQLGYNVLSGNLIWGIESDVSLTDVDPDGTCPFSAALSCDIDITALATVRGRVGYASGNWMVYATGGAAGGDFDITTSGLAGSSHDNDGEYGWTVGAGVEYLLGGGLPGPRNVGFKLEYRYLSFGDVHIDNAPGSGKQDVGIDAHVIMGGVNWHF